MLMAKKPAKPIERDRRMVEIRKYLMNAIGETGFTQPTGSEGSRVSVSFSPNTLMIQRRPPNPAMTKKISLHDSSPSGPKSTAPRNPPKMGPMTEGGRKGGERANKGSGVKEALAWPDKGAEEEEAEGLTPLRDLIHVGDRAGANNGGGG